MRTRNQGREVLEHLAYLRDRRYRRQAHAAFRRASNKAGLQAMTVRHEARYGCCAVEAWPVTAGRIRAALAEDGVRAAWLFADGVLA